MSDVTAYSAMFDGTSGYAQAPSVAAYDFGPGDFTIEAWVRTTTGGPVATQMGADTQTGSGWGLTVLPTGQVELTTFSPGGSVTATTTAAPPTFDGSWHHLAAVRIGVDVIVTFDGVPQPLTFDINGSPPIDVSGNLPLTIGATSLVGGQTDRSYFEGSIDEVRLWNEALALWQIDQNIYHIVTTGRDRLVAQYGFDDKSGADTSGKGNDLTLQGSVLFGDPAFYFVPEGQPFMAVQVRLMDDYHYDAAQPSTAPTPTRALRVALSARESDGQGRAAALTLTADVDTTVYTQGTTTTIGPSTPVTFQTNALMQLNVSLFLVDDSLVAPVLKVHADFMDADQRIVVPLDRDLHFRLAEVTGPDLQDPAAPVLDPADFTADQAVGVAQTVGNVMSAAVQHDMQPSEEVVRDRGTPLPHLRVSTRRVLVAAARTGLPERENYLPVEMENPVLMPTSDLLRCVYLPEDLPVERVVVPGFMPVPHFTFEVASRTFTPMTPSEALGTIADRMARPDALSTASPQVTLRTAEGVEVSATSLWDQFVQGLLDVVDWVVSVGESIADGLKVVISYVIDGVTKFFDFVVGTVVEAAEFVVGMFRAIGVALGKVIDFLAALFNVEDILRTHRVTYRFLQESAQFGLAAIQDLKSSADGMLDTAKAAVDDYFDKAIASLGGSSAAGQSEGGALDQPTSVQADYVRQHTAEADLQQPTTMANVPDDGDLSTMVSGVTSGGGTDLSSLQATNQAHLTSFVQDAPLNEVLKTLLEFVEGSLDLAIDVAKAVVDTIFDLLIEGYQMVLGAADTRVDIPVLTWFYEEVICGGDGSTLTFLDLMALLGAVPTSVLSHLFHDEAPFTASFETQFQSETWQDYGFYHLPSQAMASAAAGQPLLRTNARLEAKQPDWMAPLSWAQGFVFTGSVAVWFGATAFKDAANVSVLNAAFKPATMAPVVIGEFAAQLGSFPIHTTYGTGEPAALEVAIWSLQWLPFGVDVADWVLAVKKPAGTAASNYVDEVENAVVGIWGVIHLLMFVALLAWEEVANTEDPKKDADDKLADGVDLGFKGGANIVSTFPELAGFARYSLDDPKVKAAVVVVDAGSAVAVSLVTLGRTIAAIVRKTVVDAR